MLQTFHIAASEVTAGFVFVGKKCKVDKDLFNLILIDRVRAFTSKKPKEYNRVLEDSKKAILGGKPLTIGNMTFIIKGKI